MRPVHTMLSVILVVASAAPAGDAAKPKAAGPLNASSMRKLVEMLTRRQRLAGNLPKTYEQMRRDIETDKSDPAPPRRDMQALGEQIRRSGIGQGVNGTTMKEIRTRGGWVAASITPEGRWKYNTGISLEDVEDGDLNAGDRSQNRSIFGNAIYTINKNTSIGFELSQWQTKRKGESTADDLRAQTSFIYKF